MKNMDLDKFTFRIKKRRINPPRVKITNAVEGLLEIRTTEKTTKGKYELSLESKEHAPIVFNVEIE